MTTIDSDAPWFYGENTTTIHEMFVSLSELDCERLSDYCWTSVFKDDSWMGNLLSVNERRNRFLKSVRLSSNCLVKDEEINQVKDNFLGVMD